ncbi:MAG: toll/interleukin-1 receptor domain-containing protein [Bacteroidota bacterium]
MSGSHKLTLIRNAINRKGIVPILGNDLSRLKIKKADIPDIDRLNVLVNKISDEDEHIVINLYDYLAFQLIRTYHVADPPTPFNLNNVVLTLMNELGEAEDAVKDEIIRIFSEEIKNEELMLDVYRKLTRIEGFQTILTVNFDNFLERAFEAENNTHVNPSVNFAIHNSDDVNEQKHDPQLKNIFNLKGSIHGTDFALTEEMSLEYLYRLQNENDKKKTDLFKAVKGKAILLIGCTFPDWFMRFFIRTISDDRFVDGRRKKYVASDHIAEASNLASFLKNYKTNVIPIGVDLEDDQNEKVYSSTFEFVDELVDELEENEGLVQNEPLYKEKVFLSYSWGDKPLVTKLKNEFEKSGVELFFDEDDLRNGERFGDTISGYINNCDYIVPIISENSIKNKESYVYSKEWTRAIIIEQFKGSTDQFPDGRDTYIRPYIIDGTSPTDDRIPEEIRSRNITSIPSEKEFGKIVRTFIKENNLTKIKGEEDAAHE